MPDVLDSIQGVIAGVLLGVFFFGGLAWTIRKGLTAGNPALWFFGSSVIRIAIVLAGFYLVAQGSWQRLLICLAGFFLARIVILRFFRPVRKLYAPQKEAPLETQSR